MQALSIAGGATPFAALNNIIILRRTPGGLVLLDAADEFSDWLYHSYDHDVIELQVGASMTIAEHLLPAELALDATAPAGGGRHGFSVGHARRSNPDLDVELVFEPVAKDLEMELPHP